METFYADERIKSERHRQRIIAQYPLWETLTDFADAAFRLNLKYQDFIDKPDSKVDRRIITLLLTKLEEGWLAICEAELLRKDEEE